MSKDRRKLQLPKGMTRIDVIVALRVRRVELTKRLMAVKAAQRELAAEQERIERDLRDVNASEDLLADDDG